MTEKALFTRTLTVKGIPMEITWKAVRVLRITVHSDCRVCITAPRKTSPEELYSFIDSKFVWLEKHLKQYQETARRNPGGVNRFVDGELHYVWGIPHELRMVERPGHPKIVLEGAASAASAGRQTAQLMLMYVRPGSTSAQKQVLLDKWRKSLVAQAAPLLTAKWEGALEKAGKRRIVPGLGFKVEKIYLQKMKTHWGSCNPARRTIRLNTGLAAKSPECLDYVVLHEMVHFITSAHNRVFYGYMNKLMPGWKEIRKKMNRGEL
jgi:predicted metal-dependent hydrolase